MSRRHALLLSLALTSCSSGARREDGAGEVAVIRGVGHDAQVRAVAARPAPTPRTAARSPLTSAPPPREIGAPTPVQGDFTVQPLPAELAHLGGLGARRSPAEEKTP